jgi:hypothetical protein
MAFDLTIRAFDQLRREVDKAKGIPIDLDYGTTVKPEDIQVTQDHIDKIREGESCRCLRRRTARKRASEFPHQPKEYPMRYNSTI